MHWLLPVAYWNVPGEQVVQSVAPETFENAPISHASHPVLLVRLENDPAMQL